MSPVQVAQHVWSVINANGDGAYMLVQVVALSFVFAWLFPFFRGKEGKA